MKNNIMAEKIQAQKEELFEQKIKNELLRSWAEGYKAGVNNTAKDILANTSEDATPDTIIENIKNYCDELINKSGRTADENIENTEEVNEQEE